MHPYAQLELDYRNFQSATFRLESLAYSHSEIEYDPVGEPVEIEAGDSWIEQKLDEELDRAIELRKETGESFVQARQYEGETGEQAEELREYWHSQYFKLGDAVREISSSFRDSGYGEEIDTEAEYRDAVAEAGGREKDE